MQPGGFQTPTAQTIEPPLRLTRFVALSANAVAGSIYSLGDVLQKTEKVDTATNAVTLVEWRDLDTDTTIATAPAVPTVAKLLVTGETLPVGADESLSVSATSVGFAAIPANANFAVAQVTSGSIFYTTGGAAATAAGQRSDAGTAITLNSRQEILNFKAIQNGVASTVVVAYERRF